jgi:hypothetical protein
MKTAPLIWLLLLVASAFASAQNTQTSEYYRPKVKPANKKERVERYDIYLGIKGGVNRGSVLINRPSEVHEFSPQTGFNSVLFASIAGLGNPLSLQLEVGYMNKRSGWVVDYQDTLTEQIFDLRYLTVPFMLKFAFGRYQDPQRTHVFGLVGTELNFLLSGNLRLNTEAYNYEAVFDESRRISPWEAGVILGAGASFPLTRGISLIIEGRGGLGLTNFNRGVIIYDYKLRNIYAQINTGLAIHL